ncbi:hypothetical protein HNP40_000068 [Mycobacteroides chelonae]|nr:hypothetical protein [Mycobacteroides chelonae]
MHEMTLGYVDPLSESERARVVDEHGDLPVTASVQLVSIVDDGARHLGQAAYLRGIIPTN